MSSYMRLDHISKIFSHWVMSILSQNLPNVLYFLKFLVFYSKRNTASHMIQPDLETSDNGVFLFFFCIFWLTCPHCGTSVNFTKLQWTSLNFTESHWSSLKFTVNTWARGKSSICTCLARYNIYTFGWLARMYSQDAQESVCLWESLQVGESACEGEPVHASLRA